MRILLIEDDTVLGAAVRDQVADGHSVDWVQRLDAAGDAIAGAAFDLVLLDLMLPDGRGIPFLRKLRAKGDVTPVIILTALDQISDRIEGLNAGADDYLVKPFDLDELAARVRALARRQRGGAEPQMQLGALVLDPAAHAVMLDAQPVKLSAREFALLEALFEADGKPLSRARLEERVYGWGEEVESNAIEVHIHALRRKLGAGWIRNLRGVGYTLSEPT